MSHSSNIISSIKLPDGTTYEIHDAQAIHSAEDLGLSAALKFKGTKSTDAEILALTSADVGDVWHSTASDTEYVCVTAVSGTADSDAWEELGPARDAASSSHTHSVTVTGTNAASTVTGSVTIPTVSKTQKYLSATVGTPGVTTTTATPITGFGSHTTATVPTALTTTTVKNPTVTAVTIPNVTGNEEVTASKVTTTSVSIPNVTGNSTVTASKISANTSVSIPNVTGNTSVTASKVSTTAGTAAAWSASVSDGVLSFSWAANTPTAVTATDVSASKVTLGTALTASKITASDVTASKVTLGTAISASQVSASDVTASKVTMGDDLTASSVSTSSVTVATGSFKSSASAITGLGTPTTATVLTGVTMSAPSITLTNNSSNVSGSVPVVSDVTIGSTSASLTNGSAAAQKWTQSSGTTGTPQ